MSCSFCGKAETEVKKLISGPGVSICDVCVQLCNDVLGQTPSVPFELPRSDLMTDEEMLELLPRFASVSAQVDAGLRTWVDRLRDRDVTWVRIGTALGMTRQSAWEKFAPEA